MIPYLERGERDLYTGLSVGRKSALIPMRDRMYLNLAEAGG